MQTLARIFNCCTQNNSQQSEVTLHLTQRRTRSACPRTARIQRSTPKRSHLDTSIINSQHLNLTISTHTNSTGLKNRKNRWNDSESTPKSSKQHGLSLSLKPKKEERSCSPKHKEQYSPSHIQSIEKVINIEEKKILPKNNPNETDLKEMEKIGQNPQPPSIKAPAPRLLLQRRKKQKKQDTIIQSKLPQNQNISEKKVTFTRKSPLIVSVLEPIEERLSLPSCTESQAHEINRIPSRSVFFQEGDRLPDISPLAQKHTSCTFNRDGINNSGIKSTKSQNFKQFQEKISFDHEQLINNKIKVDIEIHEKQWKTLLEEEKCLLDNILFQKQRYQVQLNRLQEVKEHLNKNIEILKEKRKQKEKNNEIIAEKERQKNNFN